MTSKRELSERDICTQFILPALKKAGWDIERQIREEVSFTDGRIYVKGQTTARGSRKRADYILYHKQTSQLPSSKPRTTHILSERDYNRR